MKAKRFIVSLPIALSLFSCSKDEENFVGKYKTYFAAPIFIQDKWSADPEVMVGKRFKDLSSLELDLFMDSKGELAGECTINQKRKKKLSSTTVVGTETASLNAVNFRLKGDTLIFSLESGGFRAKSKLVKTDGGAVIGFDESGETVVINDHGGPFSAGNKSGFGFFACKGEAESQQVIRKFFEGQRDELNDKIRTEQNKMKRRFLENSLKEVTARIK